MIELLCHIPESIKRNILKVDYTKNYNKQIRTFKFKDKGLTTLYWYKHKLSDTQSSKSLICIHPGLNFKGAAAYIEYPLNYFKNLNTVYDIVVITTRGEYEQEHLHDPSIRNIMGQYGNDEDTREVYDYLYSLKERYVKYVSIGFSLGGKILTNYMTCNPDNRISYAAFVMGAQDLSVCNQYGCYFMQMLLCHLFKAQIHNSLNFYQKSFARNSLLYNVQPDSIHSRLSTSITIQDLDENVGKITYTNDEREKHSNVDEYYFKNNMSKKLKLNDKCILVIADKDDMVVPYYNIGKSSLELYKNIVLVETKMGGHLGTIESWFNVYYGRILCEYINWMDSTMKNTD